MKNLDVLTTLFVGIDVSSKTNAIYAMDFHSNKLLSVSVPNTQVGAETLVSQIHSLMEGSKFEAVCYAMESTSFYGMHLANFLSSDSISLSDNPYVYCLNPKMIANYRKSFIGMAKTDPIDAFIIADFARVGRITIEPWRGSQFLALQRLTRHRLHLVGLLTREKTYMTANVFLKFSQMSLLKKKEHPFAHNHTATAEAVLTEFFSLQEIIDTPAEELIEFLCKKSKNRIVDVEQTASILKKAASDSYRLDKTLYEPLNIAISSSYSCIASFEKEIKQIDRAIEKNIRGLQNNEYQCLQSIPGIGPVFASGILAELGSMKNFHSNDALAKYAGIYWGRNQSGEYEADNTNMVKAGNKFLRYYIIEATSSVIRNIPEYNAFYQKKFSEVKNHQHKRALALTSRKFIRLIFGLLAKDQLYSPSKVGQI